MGLQAKERGSPSEGRAVPHQSPNNYIRASCSRLCDVPIILSLWGTLGMLNRPDFESDNNKSLRCTREEHNSRHRCLQISPLPWVDKQMSLS